MKKYFSKFIFIIIFMQFIQTVTCHYPSNPEYICPEAGANPESLGIFSETEPILYPNINCYIGTYHGRASTITIEPDFEVKKDGLKSLKTTLSVGCYDGTWGYECGYAGWFVCWGNDDSFDDESCTRNMSDYANGRLTFWIKSTESCYVGIRSGNVPEGEERSKVYLSSGFYNFEEDGNWHKVCIPISHFEGAYPRADLNRIKVLFFIAAPWSTGEEPMTFWIDDIRWEFNPCPDKAPIIELISFSRSIVYPGETVEFYVKASDYENDELDYKYEPSGGQIEGTGNRVSWIAPSDPGEYQIIIIVSDKSNNSVQDTTKVFVRDIRNNSQPIISDFSTNINNPLLGETIALQVSAIDQDGDPLSYIYKVDEKIIEGTTPKTYWTVGPEVKDYLITVAVEDPYGGRAESYLMISACDADEIGIFSESIYYNIIPYVNSYTGIIVKGRAICDSFYIDSVVKCEGEFSQKIIMSVASRNECCGWFVQHGVEETSDAHKGFKQFCRWIFKVFC